MCKKVLLIEDDSFLRRSMERAFCKAGFSVESAVSAAEAACLVKNSRFDAVISDNRLVGESGSSFLHQLASEQPDLVRFMLTGDLDAAQARELTEQQSVQQIFQKPCDLREILRELQSLFQTREDNEGAEDQEFFYARQKVG